MNRDNNEEANISSQQDHASKQRRLSESDHRSQQQQRNGKVDKEEMTILRRLLNLGNGILYVASQLIPLSITASVQSTSNASSAVASAISLPSSTGFAYIDQSKFSSLFDLWKTFGFGSDQWHYVSSLSEIIKLSKPYPCYIMIQYVIQYFNCAF